MFPARKQPRVCDNNETYISAKPYKTQTYPRFPGQNGYERRSPGHQTQAPQAARPFNPLTVPTGEVATARQSFSFSRLSRLLSPAQFQRVFSRAQRSGDRYFTVLYCGNESETARLGFAIAKKRIHRAVGRNRLRRLARESFRKEFSKLGGIDIIIMAQTVADTATNAELNASLAQHWERMRKGEDNSRRHRQKDSDN